MKVLLINSPFRVKISKDSRWPEFTKSGTLYYPFWLSYATAVLMEKTDHEPLLIDAVATEMNFNTALKKIEHFKPELVVVETSTPTITSDVDFVNKVKEINDVKIAMAGKHVSALPIESMKMSNNIDFVLRGEYDYTVKDIADALENNGTHTEVFKNIPGITFRENGKFINTPPRPLIQDLDALPFVSKAYKKFLNPYWYRYALAQYPMLQTWTSRGCPARCVYCVDENSTIIISNNDEFQVTSVKSFVDNLLFKNSEKIGEYEFSDINELGIKVWSNNKFVHVRKISRVKNSKKTLLIKLSRGKYIKVSDDHRIPIIRNGEKIIVQSNELKTGDKLIYASVPDFDRNIKTIDIAKELVEKIPPLLLKDVYIHDLNACFEYLTSIYGEEFIKMKKTLKKNWITNRILPIEVFHSLRQNFEIPNEILKDLEVGGKNLSPVPLLLDVNKELMTLIGLFVAEGSYSGYSSVITCSRKDIQMKIKEMIEKVFPKTYITIYEPTEERGGQIFFGGKIPFLIFRKIFDILGYALQKKLPDIVFNVSEDKMTACLKGLFTGDGTWSERKISYSTISEVLLNQVNYLLETTNMSPSITVRENTQERIFRERKIISKHTLYSSYVASWDDRQTFVDKLGFMDERQNRLTQFQEEHKPLKVKILESLNEPKTITDISKEIGTSPEVTRYVVRKLNKDGIVKVENNFGRTNIIHPNLTNDSNKVPSFLEILDIREVEGGEYLYDMETDDHYFSVNGVLVHNCDYPQVFTLHAFRMRSPENVVDEIEFINKKLPQVREIFMEDDTFTINRERVLKICEEIKERGLDVIWSCNARAQLDYELMKTMKDAGARILIVGYESGNQQVLNNIRKGVVLTQAERFTRDAKKAGLRIFGCFMIGLPGDTKESIEDTFQFAKRMNPDMVFFQQAVPFPGTEFYAWAKHNGYLVTEDFGQWLDENGQLKCLVSYPHLTAKEINEIRDKLMVKFYTNPKHMWQTVTKNLNPVEGVRVVNYALKYLAYLSKRMTKARKDWGIASNGHMINGNERNELYLH